MIDLFACGWLMLVSGSVWVFGCDAEQMRPDEAGAAAPSAWAAVRVLPCPSGQGQVRV
jgi:hypothetical protein